MHEAQAKQHGTVRPSRRLVRVGREAASPGPRDLLRTATWFGLLGGLLELGAIGLQDWLDPRVTVGDIRTNRHVGWMLPVSDLALALVIGAGLALLATRWRAVADRLGRYGLISLALAAPLLGVRGLHPLAALALAIGMASRAAPAIERHDLGFRRMIRASLPPMLGGLIALVVLRGGAIVRAEARALAALPPPRAGAPNVLLLVMDNVRADHMSLHGYGRPTTPNLHRIAARGIRFDGARSTAPWTLPSHASMLTGRWPHELSATAVRPLDGARPTLAEFLAGHGYAAAGFVANTYYCNAWYGLNRGFARYEDFPQNEAITPGEILRSSAIGRRLAEACGDRPEQPGDPGARKSVDRINGDVLQWIDRRGDRPFFVLANYYDAHQPFDPPPGAPRRFGLSALDRSQRAAFLKRQRDLGRGRITDPAEAERASREAAQLLADSSDDCLAALDAGIGRLFEELDRRGRLRDTLVIVTSDHGEHFGERGLFGHGHSLYRPLVDVPLIIWKPGDQGGRVIGEPVSLRDIPATIADAAGLAAESPFPGRSLLKLGPEREAPRSEVEHQTKFPPSAHIPASRGALEGVVAEGHSYIKHQDGTEELYDLAADPGETLNRAGDPASRAVLERLRAATVRR